MSDLIGAHLAHCRAAGYSRFTIRDRGEVLHRVHADLPWGLYEATTEELADWLAGPLAPPWSAQTKATYYTHVTGFYRWACDPRTAGGLDYDPSAGLTRPRVHRGLPNPFNEEELRAIIDGAAEPYRTWALFALLAGARCGDLAHLRREHITQETITFVHGKGGKSRTVPTHPDIWRSVRDLPPGPIALRLDTGMPAGQEYISASSRHHFRRRRVISRGGLHRGRHWFGTTTLRAVGNLRVVQELMGHASPATTAGYTLITSEERRAAIQALPTLATAL
jgi:integrase/recombinase XerC